MTESYDVPSETDMLDFGQTLAQKLSPGDVVYLSGDLGVGKTTLVRGLLRALGYLDRVKSPSYGLVESYDIAGRQIHHLDLYRLGHAEEIEYLGIPDLLDENSLLLIEWAEKGEGYLPAATLRIRIEDRSSGGRKLTLNSVPSSC
jgi:tRNA threonylcarbamoyladenosine biosynthesis protein TsaE